MSTRIWQVRFKYSICDLINDVITCTVWSCYTGKINASDKLTFKSQKTGNIIIKEIFTWSPSKRSFRHRIHNFLRRADARERADIIIIPHHSVNSCSHNVNGDIAIQWEWSKFDPSQNQNPLTNYDKTLPNWLCPRDEHVTQNLCQSAVRERLAKYVKHKASLFYFYFYFFPGLAYRSNPCMEFHARCLKTRAVT